MVYLGNSEQRAFERAEAKQINFSKKKRLHTINRFYESIMKKLFQRQFLALLYESKKLENIGLKYEPRSRK